MLASKVCRQLSEVLKGESEKWKVESGLIM